MTPCSLDAQRALDTLDNLDALIGRRSILEHPFYRAWTAGRLTAGQLATYAAAYYPHVAAFPDYLRAAIAGTRSAAVRDELGDNLREELGEPAPHPELWKRFAAAAGAPEGSLAETTPRTAATVATFRRLCAGGDAPALAALYAYESQQPEVACRKAEGLRQHYGIVDPEALAYFTVHAEADVRHRQGERRALESCLAAGAAPETLLAAAGDALDAYWGLLDGVCETAGIPLDC
jgi:pyrroloquinoline-quinone synthase